MLSLEDRLAEHRATFVANSRRKVAEIDALLESLERDPFDAGAAWDLSRLFHSLAAVGRTYGFPALGEEGTEAARISDAVVKAGTSTPEECALLRSAARRIADALQEGPEARSRFASKEDDRPKPPLEMVIASADESLLESVAALARRVAFEPRKARSVDEARQIIAEGVPAAVLVDAGLEEGTAYSIVEHLRTLPAGEGAYAAVTSRGEPFVDNVEAIRCGADQFLPKPIDMDALERRLRLIHEQRRTAAPCVLTVEDDPDHAAYVTSILETAGYQVRVCDDPSGFETALAEFRPDLVLMDAVFPDRVRAHELVRSIRQRDEYASLPVIFLTTEGRIEGSADGNDHLTRPISPSHLVSSVATRIERSRVLRGLLQKDGLTGLLTHSAFSERLRVAVAERQGHASSTVALVMIDVDHFKAVNDAYGHPVGDKVLASLAALLTHRLRRSDSVARYGGEEFAFLLCDVQETAAVRIASGLLEAFGAIEHAAPGFAPFRVTFSAGVSMLRPGDDVESWRIRADSALHAAKSGGRARVVAE